MKKLTKILSLLLIAAMLLAFAACANTDTNDTTDPTTTADSSSTNPSEISSETLKVPDDFKVGILHISSVAIQSGYTWAHHKGFLEMVSTLGVKESQIVVKDDVPDNDVTKTKQALQEMVDADCDLIFATSYNYMNTVKEFADEYPDVIFSHCSGYLSNDKNFNNYFGRIYEARYLSGIAAGLKMKEDGKKIAGYVAAMNNQNAEVTGGINAFALGIQSVLPDAEVKVKVTGSWYAPEQEGAAAQALIDAGAYVIAQHCDTENPQLKASDGKVFGVGYNTDMTTEATKNSHIIAPIWNWGVYYTEATKAVINGTWKSVNYYGGTKEGLIGLSPLNTAVAAKDTQTAIDAAKAKILDGSLIVFDKGLTKADGSIIDHALTDEEITGKIDYYIKGVSLL
ncbi:MAG: BMP family ABC transporter substrate-binding protein [Oscillospiraceae bacterium]|jgi:basic membrane protein A|nr:BMP family ABC transporter substrate-binding protein [Oscillospiraceae bacterium]